MKKLALAAAALVATAISVVFLPSAAGAAGGTTGTSVSINQYADWNFAGTQLDLGLQVRCSGGSGTVNVKVDQDYPDSPILVGGHGTGVQNVVCDGKTRYVTVTIIGAPYDGGKAVATATVSAPSGTDTASRQISIRAV